MSGRLPAVLATSFLLWGAACGVAADTRSPTTGESVPIETMPLPSSQTAPPPADGATTTRTVAPSTTSTTVSAVPRELMDAALAAAAEHSGLAVGALRIVTAEFVEWPDGSLGCPEPGMLYTQAIVPGYWIQIDADGELLDYRADSSGGFRLCTNPS